jgi:selenocysteine lyase/cysteine desulfurase
MSNRDSDLSFVPAPDNRRRDFFKLMGAGAAAVGTLPLLAVPTQALAAPGGFVMGEPDPAFTLDPSILFMNVGTTGSTPGLILRAFDDYNRQVARDPTANLGGTTPMREAIAPGFGARTEEIVMSYNTTDGMNKILAGVELNAGDEILTTNHEHPGGTGPMNLLKQRKGVIVTPLALPVGNNQTAQDYVNLFAANIKPNTKAFVFSAPTYLTGTMLPYKRLAALAQQHNIMTIVDGAHATGMFNMNFHETGIDYWGCSGHKWQCGPGGTGILYIRNRSSVHNPLPVFNFWPTNTNNAALTGPRTAANAATYNIGGLVQSIGNPNYPMLKAFSETCVMWDQIGRQAIQNHDLALSAYLKQKIVQNWGANHLYSPMGDPELVSALTSFNPFHGPSLQLQLGDAAAAETAQSTTFVNRLRTGYGIVVRNTAVPVIGSPANHHPLRISTHLFHSAQDVDRLVASMRELTKAMRAGR